LSENIAVLGIVWHNILSFEMQEMVISKLK